MYLLDYSHSLHPSEPYRNKKGNEEESFDTQKGNSCCGCRFETKYKTSGVAVPRRLDYVYMQHESASTIYVQYSK